jgi:predicted kinase
MKPKLIVLNGNPGMGKSTLSQRYANEHPMTLNLDVDRLWHLLGQWQVSMPQSEVQKYKFAYALAGVHLADGYSVIVADHIQHAEVYQRFQKIAEAHSAVFVEAVLLSTVDDAIERCKTRAKNMGYETGFRPGGVLDTNGREAKLTSMHQNMLAAIATREHMIRIHSVEGDIEGAYQQLLRSTL